MSQNILAHETLEQALALTQEQDERDFEYWQDQINESGWAVHLGDEHSIGRYLPYAMVVIEVQHIQGDDYFYSARNDPRNALGYPVIVFADELGSNSRNRQSDGNTYIYKLSGLDQYVQGGEQGYAALPTGLYCLEVMIPLFKTEAVTLKHAHRTGYRVSTAQGFVYDSDELEEDLGFMGLCQAVTTFAQRGFVWKLVTGPSSIREFEVEMVNRALVFWGRDDDPEVPALARMVRVRAWVENVEVPYEDFEEDEAGLKVEDVKEGVAGLTVEDSEAEKITGDTSVSTSDSDGYVVVKDETKPADDNAAELEDRSAAPWRNLSNKLKRSRHDVDELWVERGGKRFKF